MRRKDKAITNRKMLDAIIHQAEICHLACCLNGEPYLVPISFGYDGNSIYFHSAKQGKKINILAQNPQVCLAFEGKVELLENPEQACGWSFDYTSVIINGRAKQLETPSEKDHALNQIMVHYSGQSWEIPEAEAARTTVWSVEILELTGKGSAGG